MVNTSATNFTTEINVYDPAALDGTAYFTANSAGLTVNGTPVSTAEIAYLDGVTAGTVTASKAVVVDSNKDIASFRNVTCATINAGASGVTGTVNVFPTTASKGKTAITSQDNAGNTTTSIVVSAQAAARTYSIPDAGNTTASFVMSEGAQAINGEKTFSGNLTMSAVGKTLVLKQGAGSKTGTVTLNGATPVSVSNTTITVNSIVIFTLATVGGTVGAYPSIQTITASSGFTVAGTASDTSVYNYIILESAA